MSPTSPLVRRLAELSARALFGMDLGLDRVRAALAEVGDPHLHLAAVHVAGSNGKGSTCAMVEAIARAAGLRTGLTTSPHLARFAERIRLDGEPIADAPFEACLSRALAAVSGQLTFFECLTVAAFLAFREAAVDLAVIEVGLGGRLDATNVLPAPLACAITSISLEHTAVLGSTLDAIAREKAGILKPGVPYVLGALPPEAERAILDVAATTAAGPRWPHPLTPLPTALLGPHQGRNAAVAAALATLLAPRWPALLPAIPLGLAAVRWPGRFERLRAPEALLLGERDLTLLLDGAHNPEGALALRDALTAAAVAPAHTTLVFGALADKSYAAVLTTLVPCAARHVYTCPQGRAPAPFADLTRIAPGPTFASPAAALAHAIAITPPGGAIVVTGSLYLVGEFRAHALGTVPDPVIPL